MCFFHICLLFDYLYSGDKPNIVSCVFACSTIAIKSSLILSNAIYEIIDKVEIALKMQSNSTCTQIVTNIIVDIVVLASQLSHHDSVHMCRAIGDGAPEGWHGDSDCVHWNTRLFPVCKMAA